MKAVIHKSTGSWYTAKIAEKGLVQCRIKGIFKIDDISSTNPIAVGDEVEVQEENEIENTYLINEIYERRNYVARQSPHNKKQHHIIAANLDQSILFATLTEPKTSQGFIDRFLTSCEAFHIPAVLVFNKYDLYRKKEQQVFEEWQEMYTRIGYKVLAISLKEKQNLEEFVAILKDKISLLSGHSGVGKSTFINQIVPGIELRTTEVSGWSGKGMHTTTFAEMHDLPFGGSIIDTPGMREFGLVHISKNELSHYFPEMLQALNTCKFNNCMHVNEPGCGIKAAVASNNIHIKRYESYLNILGSIDAAW